MILGKKEYATHILFVDGEIVNSLNIEYSFDNASPIKGKDKTLNKSIVNCPYLEIFTDILKLVKYEGLCCFNYKEVDGYFLATKFSIEQDDLLIKIIINNWSLH